ncbi:hypothetical protein MASR2M39_05680 [Ignavibacteriales bacterium]
MKYAFIFITALLLVVSSADAQPGGGRGKFRNRGGDPMKKLEQLEKVKLIETLNLEEETMLKLFSRRADHQKVMEERNHKADLILDEMEELIADNKDGSKNKEITAKIAEFGQFVDQTRRIQHQFISSLSEILDPESHAKYIVFERNFRRELRDLLKKD